MHFTKPRSLHTHSLWQIHRCRRVVELQPLTSWGTGIWIPLIYRSWCTWFITKATTRLCCNFLCWHFSWASKSNMVIHQVPPRPFCFEQPHAVSKHFPPTLHAHHCYIFYTSLAWCDILQSLAMLVSCMTVEMQYLAPPAQLAHHQPFQPFSWQSLAGIRLAP